MVKDKDKIDNNIIKKIMLAANWADDNTNQDEKFEVKLNDIQKGAILRLIETLRSFSNMQNTAENAKSLQSKVFDVARSNNLEPKELFTLLYMMFLNANRGPRIGNYFLDLGVNKVIQVLCKYVE
jgi:lysyl-tRNA synthetase class 1